MLLNFWHVLNESEGIDSNLLHHVRGGLKFTIRNFDIDF